MYSSKHLITRFSYINYTILVWLSLIEFIKIIQRYNSDVILICSDVDRGDERDGKPYSKIIDTIHEDLRKRNLKVSQVAHLGSSLVGSKAWGEPISINHIITLSELIEAGLNKNNIIVPNIYKRIFSVLNPCVVLAIGATDVQCRTMKRMGIPIVEVLHGIGFQIICWDFDTKEKSNLPTHILSFDSKSTETFLPLQNRGVKLIESQHPWYKRFQETANNGESLWPEWIKEASFIPKDKKIVLISLTWGYTGEKKMFEGILADGLMPNALKNVIKNTSDDVFYCIRRHPVQVRDKKYDYQIEYLDDFVMKHKNCEWRMSTTYPMVSVLKQCDVHISMISMSAYDAAIFGIRSLLLCPTLHGINRVELSDLIENGYADKTIKDEGEIEEWIKKARIMSPYILTNKTDKDWNQFLDSVLKK